MVDETETPAKKPEAKSTRIVFTGRGSHRRVPARDLTKKEWMSLPKKLRDSLLGQGIYQEVEQ